MLFIEEQFVLEAIAVSPLGTANIATANSTIVFARLKVLFTIANSISPINAKG